MPDDRKDNSYVLVPREPTDTLSSNLAQCHPSQLNDKRRAYARKKWQHLIEDALNTTQAK